MRAKISKALLGALVGDAVGVSFEFKLGHEIPAKETIQMVMPASFGKTYGAIPYGTWSDDGSLLMCLHASLSAHPEFNAEDFGQRMVRWLRQCYMQSGGVVFDVGGATRAAIQRIEAGVPAAEAGGPDAAGNGSLMRTLPVALHGWKRGWTPERIVDVAMRQSAVTHAHPEALVTCALYALTAASLLENDGMPVTEAVSRSSNMLYAEIHGRNDWFEVLDRVIEYPRTNLCTGRGYVVDSFWSAISAIEAASGYTDAIQRAISLGNDTDTTACVAGGLAGIMYGHEIPKEWASELHIPEEAAPLLIGAG